MRHSHLYLGGFLSLMLTVLSTGPSAAEPIATTDGDIPGTRVEVTELKRSSGGTLTLKLVMYNDDPSNRLEFKAGKFGDETYKGNKDYQSVGGIHLIDPVNKKKYLVVRDSEENCVCSRDLGWIEPNAKTNLWAKFPAPPEDVETISVVIPHFIPMDDVPISK